MKKLIGILFTTPMVEALLAGLKSQTRRITGKLKLINANLSYDWKLTTERVLLRDAKTKQERYRTVYRFDATGINTVAMFCPYGEVGDVLWVRETFWDSTYTREINGFLVDLPGKFFYKTDEARLKEHYGGVKWAPSLHMPYVACRLWLEVVSVRIERLQEISDVDAIAEGIERKPEHPNFPGTPRYKYYGSQPVKSVEPLLSTADPVFSYASIWDSINGPDSWKQNPYVWVVKFKQIEKPADND